MQFKLTLLTVLALAVSALSIPTGAPTDDSNSGDVFIVGDAISAESLGSLVPLYGDSNTGTVADDLTLDGRGLSLEARATLQDTMLSLHNNFRAKFGAGALKWNANLASGADSHARGCKFQHSSGNYGENLSAGSGSFTAEAGFKLWSNEASKYNYASPGFSSGTGHFTQVVWKNTKEVGCGFASCGAGTIFSGQASKYLVCRYSAPGNVLGQFPANVGRPL